MGGVIRSGDWLTRERMTRVAVISGIISLAIMPYLLALFVWQAATLVPFAAMIRRFTGRREAWLFALAAPVSLICIMHGHNGFLTALLLGGGLMLLEKKPFAAGLLLGCLLDKP